ncbi:MAG: head GIN domain-containing protein [Cyclobacteriaceae bacterium]
MKRTTLFLVLLAMGSLATAQTRETRNVDTFTKLAFRIPGKLYIRQGSPQKLELEGRPDVLKEIDTDVSGGKLVIEREGRWMNWGWNNDERINVYITVKDLSAVNVSGSGDAIVEGVFKAEDLDLSVSGSGSLEIEATVAGRLSAHVSGSGDLNVKGNCQQLKSVVSGSGKVNITSDVRDLADFSVSGSGKISANGTAKAVYAGISGSGKVLASNLETEKCEVRITGSGDVEVNVKNDLDASITGSGSVNYKGNPSHINSHATGSGHVRKM